MKDNYTTTLKALRDNSACESGYDLIANHVGVDFEGDFSLEKILDNNGLSDCIWALRATEGGKELAVDFAIVCSTRVYAEPNYIDWAKKWMSGEDRTANSARAAYAANVAYAAHAANAAYAAKAAARAAARAADAANSAAYAAKAAANSADDATYAADVAYAARAAKVAKAAIVAEEKWQKETLRKLIRNEFTGE